MGQAFGPQILAAILGLEQRLDVKFAGLEISKSHSFNLKAAASGEAARALRRIPIIQANGALQVAASQTHTHTHMRTHSITLTPRTTFAHGHFPICKQYVVAAKYMTDSAVQPCQCVRTICTTLP